MSTSELFSKLATLHTQRLLLRPLRADDAEAIFQYGCDPEVTRYVIWETHRTINDAALFISDMLDRYRNNEVAPWAFEERATGRVIGSGGFCIWDQEHHRAEFGYSIGRRDWNQGFTTEASRAIISFGFSHMNLNRIEAQCDVRNGASARVMEKVGMTFEGELRERTFMKGTHCTTRLYSILRSEWATHA